MDYREAGVDVEAGYEAVSLMKRHVQRTFDENVLGGLGSFGGFYALPKGCGQEPVLVAGTDGVGTKLKVAFAMDKHDTVGIDAVAMCVNDIVCQGAKPLFFLDYIATGKLVPQRVEQIVKGVSDGCVTAGCALIGGETAEMPGFYPDNEYDLAGFSVGLVDRSQVINGSAVREGDLLIGLASDGVHSNGFSLVRKLLMQDEKMLHEYSYDLGCTLGEELLRPTKIYVQTVLKTIEKFKIHGIAHMTGGGFIENIPRIIPEGLQANIELGSWPMLPIFGILKLKGDLSIPSMYNTFNMSIGMVMAIPEEIGQGVLQFINRDCGQQAFVIGEVARGDERIRLCD